MASIEPAEKPCFKLPSKALQLQTFCNSFDPQDSPHLSLFSCEWTTATTGFLYRPRKAAYRRTHWDPRQRQISFSSATQCTKNIWPPILLFNLCITLNFKSIIFDFRFDFRRMWSVQFKFWKAKTAWEIPSVSFFEIIGVSEYRPKMLGFKWGNKTDACLCSICWDSV